MHYLKDNELTESMSDSALNAEQITEIVKKQVEEEISNEPKQRLS